MSFVIYVRCDSLVDLPDVKKVLCENAGFRETGSTLEQEADSNDILDVLNNLCQALAA